MMDFLSMLKPEHLTDDQLAIAEIVGMDAYRELVKIFGGSDIRIMKEDTLVKDMRDAAICDEYTGQNLRAICLKYNLSDKQVRNIIKTKRQARIGARGVTG